MVPAHGLGFTHDSIRGSGGYGSLSPPIGAEEESGPKRKREKRKKNFPGASLSEVGLEPTSYNPTWIN